MRLIDADALKDKLYERIKTQRSTMEIIRDIIPLVDAIPEATGWNLVGEKLPEIGELCVVIAQRSRWILNYGEDWVPEEEKTYHPECIFLSVAYFRGEEWDLYAPDEEVFNTTGEKGPEDWEDLSTISERVIAWMQLPKLCEVTDRVPEADMEETVTMAENRKLREMIHDVTASCLMTKSEYAEIREIIANICKKAVRNYLEAVTQSLANNLASKK